MERSKSLTWLRSCRLWFRQMLHFSCCSVFFLVWVIIHCRSAWRRLSGQSVFEHIFIWSISVMRLKEELGVYAVPSSEKSPLERRRWRVHFRSMLLLLNDSWKSYCPFLKETISRGIQSRWKGLLVFNFEPPAVVVFLLIEIIGTYWVTFSLLKPPCFLFVRVLSVLVDKLMQKKETWETFFGAFFFFSVGGSLWFLEKCLSFDLPAQHQALSAGVEAVRDVALLQDL